MILVIAVFALTLVLGVPICVVLGLSGLAHLTAIGVDNYFNIVTQKLFSGMGVSSLTCIPFFIIAGELMNASGVTSRLIDFVRSLMGHFRGGLAYVVVIVAMVLSAILGSANAVAAILCAVIVPEMIRDGYRDDFSASLVCASGVMGPIIPPSVTFVYFSVLSGVSVNAMFMGGAIPGVMLGLGYIAVILIQTKRLNLPKSVDHFDIKNALRTFVKSIPALAVPVLLVGGITSGIFTPAESGAVAVAAAILAGLIYGEFKLSMLPKVFIKAVPVTAGIFIIIGFGTIIGWTMAIDRIPEKLTNAILGFTQSNVIIILLMFTILLVAGCVMESTAVELIFTPVMMPLALAAGMDPVQFGVWFCMMSTLGLVTPPVGVTLFVTSNVTKIPLSRLSKQIVPFLAAAVMVIMLIAFVPDIVMFLPRLLGVA